MKIKTKILIAEDDEDDRFLLKSAFDDNDFKVETCFVSDGIALIEYLQSEESLPDLILMDLNMPRKNGREILQEIRKSEEWKYIPVIILSTSKAPFDIENSYSMGANAYLVKPVSYEDLLAQIKNTINFWFYTATVFKR